MNSPQLKSFPVIVFVLNLMLAGITRGDEKRTFHVTVQAPATNYAVYITNVYQADKEIWVLAKVQRVGDFGGQAITTVKDKVTIAAPAGDVKTFVVGKTWNWEEPKSNKYLTSKEMNALLEKQRKAGTLKELYLRKPDGRKREKKLN